MTHTQNSGVLVEGETSDHRAWGEGEGGREGGRREKGGGKEGRSRWNVRVLQVYEVMRPPYAGEEIAGEEQGENR